MIKRIVALSLVMALLLACLPFSASAAEKRIVLADRNAFVQTLAEYFNSADYKVPFKCSTGWGIIDGTLKLSTSGDSYTQEYYNRIILDSVSLDPVVDMYTLNGDLSYYTDTLGELVDQVSNQLTIAKTTTTVIENACKVATAQSEYVDALSLVVSQMDDSNMQNSGRKIVKQLNSDTLLDVIVDSASDTLSSAGKAAIIKALNQYVSYILTGAGLVLGKPAGDSMYDMFLSVYQSEIALTFWDRCGDLYTADYNDEQLAELQALTALYLHTAAIQHSDSTAAGRARKAIAAVQTMNIPNQGTHLTDYSYPGEYTDRKLAVGDKYVIFGTVESSEPITKVTVMLTNERGENVIDVSSGPINTTTYNLLELDNSISIGTLAEGSYRIYYRATTSSGEHTLAMQYFQVSARTTSLSDYKLPRKVAPGGFFNVTGNISSPKPIQKVLVEIRSMDGNTVYTSAQASPASTSYNLAALDACVVFGNVTAKFARYRIVADGNVLIDQPYISG